MRILIEAESFLRKGGWLTDTASISEMGSPYVIAHGMGIPVPDAETEFEADGTEVHVWARTRDWSKIWKRGKPAGRFTVRINGEELPTELGTNGSDWAWQYAGKKLLRKGTNTVSLHDLTGFEARCDAIYISDENIAPPDGGDELMKFRAEVGDTKITDDPIGYDLIVCGGGMSGICTALAAYREGLTVALINDRKVLGGCNSSEIRVGLGGLTCYPPYKNLGRTVLETGPVFGSGATYSEEFYEDKRKLNAFRCDKLINDETYREIYLDPSKVNVLLGESVIEAEADENDEKKIKSVITLNVETGKLTRRRAKLFSDNTGDGIIARKMGAEYMYGREERSRWGEDMAPEKADRLVMGMSVMWYSEESDREESFPDIDFGIEINDKTCIFTDHGDWEWESGFRRNMISETEYIRDYATMVIYANWSHLKNRSAKKAEYANKKLAWVSLTGGKRESCRIIGDYILTQNDIENQTEFEDATAASCWDLDQHMPEPSNDDAFDEPFRSCAYHRGTVNAYAVPYRCLYARDVKNLFLGGRIISVSHVAFSSVRVMRTLGTLGEVVGMAAKVAVGKGCGPREVYTDYLDDLIALMERGVPMPQPHGYPPHSLEQYHFKEYGCLNADRVINHPVYGERVARMNINRRHPDEFYSGKEWQRIKDNIGRPDPAVMPKVKRRK